MKNNPKCEVCGEPAVILVNDFRLNFEALAKGIVGWVPHGEPHPLCTVHARESIYYDEYNL